jgi:DNA-directed RNA polymerase subunit RPC12/RpoP
MAADRCSWCGAPVESDDGYRAAEPAGSRRAVFCRLEHVVPWAIQGPHWEAGDVDEPKTPDAELERCAHCGEPVGELRVVLVRHRGEHRIPDAFCSAEHMRAWAAGGGRWR